MLVSNMVVDGVSYEIFDYGNELYARTSEGYIIGRDQYYDQVKRSFLLSQYLQLIATEIQKNVP